MTDDQTPAPATQAPDRKGLSLDNRALTMAALGLSVVALGLAAAPHFSRGGDFGGKVRAYLLENPAVLDEVLQARQNAEQAGAAQATTRAVAANPGILDDPRDPAVGPADARVTVVQFFDYRCPGCKAVSEDVLRIVRANPDVRFVFKEWPILDRGDSTTSNQAARAALAANAQGRYLAVHQALMATPGLDDQAIDTVLQANGVDLTVARAMMASDRVARHIADVHTQAQTIRVLGTPTFLVNGVATDSIDPAELNRRIAAAKRG
jgi:protein-disulfide isomerase